MHNFLLSLFIRSKIIPEEVPKMCGRNVVKILVIFARLDSFPHFFYTFLLQVILHIDVIFLHLF